MLVLAWPERLERPFEQARYQLSFHGQLDGAARRCLTNPTSHLRLFQNEHFSTRLPANWALNQNDLAAFYRCSMPSGRGASRSTHQISERRLTVVEPVEPMTPQRSLDDRRSLTLQCSGAMAEPVSTLSVVERTLGGCCSAAAAERIPAEVAVVEE
jgi:hypothetical protein